MQFDSYKIADVKDKTQIAQRLSQVENEISKDIGQDVVLIAYQKDENTARG